MSAPEVIKGYDDCTFQANKTDGMIEVIFQNDDEIRFRKGLGDEDISGNYNDFSEKSDVNVDGSTVQMKGSDGKVNLATWSADGYSYSIDSTEAMDKTAIHHPKVGALRSPKAPRRRAVIFRSHGLLQIKQGTLRFPCAGCRQLPFCGLAIWGHLALQTVPSRQVS